MNPERKIMGKPETTHHEGSQLAWQDTQKHVRFAIVSQAESLSGPVTCFCQWLLVDGKNTLTEDLMF